jgi:hypothetical protein
MMGFSPSYILMHFWMFKIPYLEKWEEIILVSEENYYVADT